MTKSRDLANAATALNAVTAAELTYVDGVTSAIQTQLDSKAPSSTAVTLTGTQTLTNKTLTNPVIASVVNNTLTTAKGDLVTATAASTPARLAVGNDGETLVADSSTSTGLRYNANYAAGKNKIINGDFGVWQRGTSFTSVFNVVTSDRWFVGYDSGSPTQTISRQAFTPGTAPVAGYEYPYYFDWAVSSASTMTIRYLWTKIENVQTYAGQTVTLSFWAKAASSTTISSYLVQNFGSGGSGNVTSSSQSNTLTTSWQRFTQTISVASISGKTIGTGSYLEADLQINSGSVQVSVFGVQLEAGSVATAFQTATGTIQGELAACQRYFEKSYELTTAPATNTTAGIAMGPMATVSGSNNINTISYKVAKRISPTIKIYTPSGSADLWTTFNSGGGQTNRSLVLSGASENGFGGYMATSADFFFQGHWTATAEL